MKIEVPNSVISETTRCPFQFSCLTTSRCGDEEMCNVESANGKNVLFVTGNAQSVAHPYSVLFGHGRVCACPTHYWLHTHRLL
jgi:hypothetical protein